TSNPSTPEKSQKMSWRLCSKRDPQRILRNGMSSRRSLTGSTSESGSATGACQQNWTPYAKQPLRFLPQRRRKSSSLLEKTRYFSLPPKRIKVSQLPGGTQSHWQTATSVEFAICLISTKTPDWTRRQSDASTFFEFPDWMPSAPTRRFGNP